MMTSSVFRLQFSDVSIWKSRIDFSNWVRDLLKFTYCILYFWKWSEPCINQVIDSSGVPRPGAGHSNRCCGSLCLLRRGLCSYEVILRQLWKGFRSTRHLFLVVPTSSSHNSFCLVLDKVICPGECCGQHSVPLSVLWFSGSRVWFLCLATGSLSSAESFSFRGSTVSFCGVFFFFSSFTLTYRTGLALGPSPHFLEG